MTMLKIGEVARQAGVTPDAIRFYERRGIIPRAARTHAGYRQYAAGIVQRLLVIRNAQRFGFSLDEIGGFLRARDAGRTPCQEVRAAAQRILDEVDRQIETLLAARGEMKQTLDEWDRKLAAARGGAPAHLLEGLHASRVAAIGRAHAMDKSRSASRASAGHDRPSRPQSKCS